jgi:hypothetical protein
LADVRLLELLSRFTPDPFSIGSKNIVTDENVTRDEADEDETSQQDVNFQLFAEQVSNLKTTVNCSSIGSVFETSCK